MGLGYLQSGPARLNRQECIQLLRAAGVCLAFNGQISPGWRRMSGNQEEENTHIFFCLVNDDELLLGGFKHEWIIFHFIYGMSFETH